MAKRGKKKSRAERERNRRKREKAVISSITVPEEHARVVENYLSCIRYAKRMVAHREPVPLEEGQETPAKTGRKLLRLLNQASIIELPMPLFQRLHKAADHYVMRELLGSDWTSVLDFGSKTLDLSREDAEKAHRANLDEIMNIGMPLDYNSKKLPFEVCFIAYGAGVPMTEHQLWPRGFTTKEGQFVGGEILGHLVTAKGTVVEFVSYADSNGDWNIKAFWHRCRYAWTEGEKKLLAEGRELELPVRWEYCYSMMPWMLPEVIRAIDDHKTVVVEKPTSFRERKRMDKELMRTGLNRVPKPFYIVYMDDKYITKRVKRTCANIRRSAQSYRCRVRSHSRILVRRGTLPLKPKYEKALLKRKYRVFKDEPLDFESYQAVKVRGHVPKQVGEWMAIRKVRVKEAIRGPEDAPFIESVRRSRKLERDGEGEEPSFGHSA